MATEVIQVRMSKGLVGLLDAAVNEDMYSSRSEVVRDAVRSYFAPRLKQEVLEEALRISKEMDEGKYTSAEEVDKEFL